MTVDQLGPDWHYDGNSPNAFRRVHGDGIIESAKLRGSKIKWAAATSDGTVFHRASYDATEVLDAYGHAHPAYALLDAVVEYRRKHPNNAAITRRNPREAIMMGMTYEIVTPESAENGEAEERGWEQELEPATLREVVKAVLDGCWHREVTHNGVIYYGEDSERDYSDGSETRRDLIIVASQRDVERIYRATKGRTC